MADSSTCSVCDQPIHLDESVYFWLDRQPVEHLSCHIRCISAKVEAPADPAYGPMS